ncbi:CPBP family intramembrane glutamic endopeptidase [Evansella cellulosilytica]|uniref:Abortive infection protein n=1 Tax=Evansella cellulosilytica (strain ATCC 21833 / DSM 2522 / FERM P-1141 / JCM 9156 / N-4) TaxID=649639 RepID=E6TVU5_EVAC2|nr:type II CAAX endopeptidase family protein [Evansella cellulosilytica]ADU28654.1 Abortive infection protein [Evansella cellulosilytica DSM 2522]
MSKRYWIILLSFIIMHLSLSFVTLPLLLRFGSFESESALLGTAVFITFTIGFFVILALTVTANRDEEFTRNKADIPDTILWSFLGIFMVYIAQIVAGLIQMYVFGIEPGSENTEQLVGFATAVPLLIIVFSVFVPIMEEIVFRKIIFGSLFKRYGFWIAALLSGVIFAIVHMDFKHLLVYLLGGIVLAYLYVKTKRIIVPIIAHVGINSFVMIVQVIFGEQIQNYLDRVENMQVIFYLFGGLF